MTTTAEHLANLTGLPLADAHDAWDHEVACPTCRGMGEEPCGEIPATRFSPRETVWRNCRACGGSASVTLDRAYHYVASHDDDGLDTWLRSTAHPALRLIDMENAS